MKYLEATQPLSLEELTFGLKIESYNIKVRKLLLYSDIFNTGDLVFHHKHLDRSQTGNGAVFTCSGFNTGII